MYIPPSFKTEEPTKLSAVMREYSFATLVTIEDGAPFASHLPLLLDDRGPHGTLVGHVARANPQWRHFADGTEALAIFAGPHAYISPSWYETEPAVPTWNYLTVHAYGVPVLIDNAARLEEVLRQTVKLYESALPNPWPGNLPADYMARMAAAVVGFEMPISRLEGKFKLGQNRSTADMRGVCEQLAQSPEPEVRKLAQWTRRECGLEE